MDNVRVSKTDYVHACIYACRHERDDEMIYIDRYDGRVSSYCNPECDFSTGSSADITRYCDDVFASSAASQVLDCMNENDTWSEIAIQALEYYDIEIDWDD